MKPSILIKIPQLHANKEENENVSLTDDCQLSVLLRSIFGNAVKKTLKWPSWWYNLSDPGNRCEMGVFH